MSTKRTMQTDRDIGARVRSLRVMKGMSQTTLGDSCGTTFQQVQKYEKGHNRISGSRLKLIADALEVEVSYFFGEAAAQKASSGADMSRLVNRADTVRLLRAFNRIDGPRRIALVHLIESMGAARN